MPATTEIYTLNLKTGSDNNEQHGCTAAMLHECCDTMTCQEGLQKLWYGTELENPRRLQLFLDELEVESNSEVSHEESMQEYQCFREKLGVTHTGNPDLIHVDFQPESGVAEALSAPVTEVATFYYDDAPPDTSFEGAKTLLEALIKDGVNVKGWAFGTTHEVITRDGVRGKGNVLLVGWATMEAHAESHNTQALKDNIHKLTTPEVKTYEMHHVRAAAYNRN